MPSLDELLESDAEASRFFESLPMFIQDQIRHAPEKVQTTQELCAFAHNAMSEGLNRPQYKSLFEDDSSNPIDF